MIGKYTFCDPEKLFFVSFAVINWIDLFIRNVKDYAQGLAVLH